MDTNLILKQLTTERDRIDAVIKLLSGSGSTTAAKTPKATRKRKKMSAAARKRIGDAIRKRWAEARKKKAA